MKKPVIAVLAGGVSAEREVSLGSGRACALALSRSFPTCLIDVKTPALPAGLDRAGMVVFSTLHGTFGEDGQMQRLLDEAGIHYAGCDAASSALTMDKTQTKAAASKVGVAGAKQHLFKATEKPAPTGIVASLGSNLVLKPNAEGSSVGLTLIANEAELAAALAKVTAGTWMLEQRIMGRELSIGVLNGKAMGVVEIRPKSGVYDYASKYTKGLTEYLAPAPLDGTATRLVQESAEKAYAACGCRDYARVDFILSANGTLYLLEINTLPGMKETSLLPMSAQCVGLDFTALVRELVMPAVQRFNLATASAKSS
ncbi:MAG: D-alanine--D-alanine ligase [Opitutaceae bacterium]|nr:D-alanine--D-alanine ligase [Cephaloticoccus sp.]MCP5530232.1 D-alanine--D-alanine ligase [Opitutaceae bacterium]